MNENPSQQSGVGDTFASQSTPQSNPFTADLKGEFTSNFGTNTNAVSQIFKEGGYGGNNKTKYIIIGVVALLIILIAAVYMMGDDTPETTGGGSTNVASEEGTEDTEYADDEAEDGDTEAKDEGDETEVAEEGESEDTEEADDTDDTDVAEEGDDLSEDVASKDTSRVSGAGAEGGSSSQYATYSGAKASRSYSPAPLSSGPISLAEPANGAQLTYDESVGAPTFSWSGGSGWLQFARDAQFTRTVRRYRVSGSSYTFRVPHPGTWYWRVENASGPSEVRSFDVLPPVRRGVAIAEPADGGVVAGNGGVVSWQGDGKVAFYRVEFNNSGSWANPPFRFATSGNSVSVTGVSPGAYQMRVGAFSEVAGRWEYTSPVNVTVQ